MTVRQHASNTARSSPAYVDHKPGPPLTWDTQHRSLECPHSPECGPTDLARFYKTRLPEENQTTMIASTVEKMHLYHTSTTLNGQDGIGFAMNHRIASCVLEWAPISVIEFVLKRSLRISQCLQFMLLQIKHHKDDETSTTLPYKIYAKSLGNTFS